MRERQRPTGLVTRDRTVATPAGIVDEPAHPVDWHAGTMRFSRREVKPADRPAGAAPGADRRGTRGRSLRSPSAVAPRNGRT